MPKYLFGGSYTTVGVKGLLKEGGSGRAKAFETAVTGLRGKVEGFYFAFGSDDVLAIADLPDAASAAAVSLAIAGAGAFRPTTTVLISPAEMDQAAKKSVAYRPPGAAAASARPAAKAVAAKPRPRAPRARAGK